jgi:hypothetical protein
MPWSTRRPVTRRSKETDEALARMCPYRRSLAGGFPVQAFVIVRGQQPCVAWFPYHSGTRVIPRRELVRSDFLALALWPGHRWFTKKTGVTVSETKSGVNNTSHASSQRNCLWSCSFWMNVDRSPSAISPPEPIHPSNRPSMSTLGTDLPQFGGRYVIS